MGLIIHRFGNELFMNADGDLLTFIPTGLGTWILASVAGDGTADNIATVQLEVLGDQLVLNTSTSRILCIPTGLNTWIADANFTPDPDPDPGPGDGNYSWPYEPTPGHWVTSEYGPRSGRFHEGMDFSGGPALLDKPIPAIGDAVVQQSGSNGAFGYSVILHHGSMDGYDWKSLYAHQPSYASRPGVGATITKGQQIGLVNNTGSSFGSHLHFEIHRCSIGGGMRWDNGNPSYSSSRTAYNPRNFFSVYGDGTWIIS